jgi:hypothetical protein
MSAPLQNWAPETVPVPSRDAGRVEIDNTGPFVAGSFARFRLVYTAGRYGIDDTGSLKICFRFASDMGKPQFDDPAKPNWVGVEASNGATLDTRFDLKLNTRPYDRTIHVKVVAGFLREGDTITLSFGTDERGPGMRVQTFVDLDFAFRVLVDPVATYTFVDVPGVPRQPIVAGPPHRWHAVLPTRRAVGDRFALSIRADDIWGNPTAPPLGTMLRLQAHGEVASLPGTASFEQGARSLRIDGLGAAAPGTLRIEVTDGDGALLAHSNPLVVEEELALRDYWGDLHAQSGETIGSGTVEAYMAYARDCAFLDAVGHQGNDFQITPAIWARIGRAMAEWNEPGRFVTIPGYEWSGNTALGGDRNVFHRREDMILHRSSHALVPERDDLDTDCWDANALFAALRKLEPRPLVWAHVGGRYADIAYSHDPEIETSVEVHSSWGTFEWLAADAFRLGYRVGIVANSDGHKGRPGYEPPGASLFGALGGLTCYRLPELTRDAMFEALAQRRHYATTGCRLFLEVEAVLDGRAVGMGEIIETAASQAELRLRIVAHAPILAIEIRRGAETLETIRPHADRPPGRRLRIEWSGAEYRGRARQTVWDGRLTLRGGSIESATPINFLNPDRPLRQVSETELAWASITTGNFAGIDLRLGDGAEGVSITTPFGIVEERLEHLSVEPKLYRYGKLERELRISREPDAHDIEEWRLGRVLDLEPGDNPLWVNIRFADGHQAWSGPIYAVRRDR